MSYVDVIDKGYAKKYLSRYVPLRKYIPTSVYILMVIDGAY